MPSATPAPDSKTEPSAELRRAYDEAFQQTLLRPSDAETLAKFAQIAVQFGDIEGAISALERLLLVEGDLPEVKLELGVLYFRLGSKEAARTYLEAAKASPDAPNEVKERAETFLKAVGG
ncbi:MAG: tetratricopeptide repeat protein [Proteobacteria bacterium]|nr:tetratricopeptide repeat protein [Pseudomonadota bacterium]